MAATVNFRTFDDLVNNKDFVQSVLVNLEGQHTSGSRQNEQTCIELIERNAADGKPFAEMNVADRERVGKFIWKELDAHLRAKEARPPVPSAASLTSSTRPNPPGAKPKQPRAELVDCPEQADGKPCDQWFRALKKDEPKHSVANIPLLIDTARKLAIDKSKLERTVSELQEQVAQFEGSASENAKRSREADGLRKENEELRRKVKQLEDENASQKQLLESFEKREDEQAQSATERLAAEARRAAASLKDGQSMSFQADPRGGVQLLVTNHDNAAALAPAVNAFQAASTIKSVATAAGMDFGAKAEAVKALTYGMDFGSSSSVPRLTQQNNRGKKDQKKTTPQVEEVDDDEPISVIVKKKQIKPTARLFKNPEHFVNLAAAINENEQYWPEEYFDVLTDEFAAAWAKANASRAACKTFLASLQKNAKK